MFLKIKTKQFFFVSYKFKKTHTPILLLISDKEFKERLIKVVKKEVNRDIPYYRWTVFV